MWGSAGAIGYWSGEITTAPSVMAIIELLRDAPASQNLFSARKLKKFVKASAHSSDEKLKSLSLLTMVLAARYLIWY